MRLNFEIDFTEEYNRSSIYVRLGCLNIFGPQRSSTLSEKARTKPLSYLSYFLIQSPIFEFQSIKLFDKDD